MKRITMPIKAMLLMPLTVSFMVLSASPSLAADEKCSVNVIGIGINCKAKTPASPASKPVAPPAQQSPESTSPVQQPAPVETPAEVPIPAPVQEPEVVAPVTEEQPEPTPTVTVIKEVIVVTPSASVPSSTPSEFPAAVAPRSEQTPTSLPTLAIDGEAAAKSSATPDIMSQAGAAAPYIFFIGLVGLASMLFIARSKKLFPFEGKHQ